jgi:hypothetical protein
VKSVVKTLGSRGYRGYWVMMFADNGPGRGADGDACRGQCCERREGKLKSGWTRKLVGKYGIFSGFRWRRVTFGGYWGS